MTVMGDTTGLISGIIVPTIPLLTGKKEWIHIVALV